VSAGARGADVVVVGGGVVGCAAAYTLAREGLEVTLLERDALAAHASGAAAGMLSPLGESAGLGPFLRYGLASLAMFEDLVPELRERSGVDAEYVPSGVLHAALDDADEAHLRAKATALAAHGLEWLDAEAAHKAQPGLAPDLRGALWSAREGHVRSPLLTRAFAGAATQLGARIETGVAVDGLLREGGRVLGVRTGAGEVRAESVVLCTGAWAPACAGWLDGALTLPIEPVRGQILALDAPRPPLRSMVVGGGVYVVPRRDGSVVVGATEERVGFDCRVTAAGLAQLLDAAPRAVPALATCTFRYGWAGLRPATPDGLPLIGPVPGHEGLFVATGHFRNGVLLAPITGRLVADLVTGKGLPEDAAAFLPERFCRPS
jgi:glycine oxidase